MDSLYLNTSHVKVNPDIRLQELEDENLNTSHVKVNQCINLVTKENFNNLNTSHVKVNLGII